MRVQDLWGERQFLKGVSPQEPCGISNVSITKGESASNCGAILINRVVSLKLETSELKKPQLDFCCGGGGSDLATIIINIL